MLGRCRGRVENAFLRASRITRSHKTLLMAFDLSRLPASSRARYRCSAFWLGYISTVVVIAAQSNEVSMMISRLWFVTWLVFMVSAYMLEKRIGFGRVASVLGRNVAAMLAVMVHQLVGFMFQLDSGRQVASFPVHTASGIILAAIVLCWWHSTAFIERDPPGTRQ